MSGEHVLRDKYNKVLGKIVNKGNGVQEGRDAYNRVKGTYDPKSDITRDAYNRVVGKGNLLAVLITTP